MNDASERRKIGDRARATGMRISRWRPGSLQPRHRGPIMAFYNFVRTADDIADHATLPPAGKTRLLDRLDAGLTGKDDSDAAAVRLRAELAAHNLSPKHAQDLLAAFKLDVTKLRYRDWDDLIGYCALSAMPVGRFVCDVHGESRDCWPANDALCAALQIINHLQDCQERLSQSRPGLHSARCARRERHERRSARRAAAPRRRCCECLHGLAERTERLLSESDVLPSLINDWRLGLEVSVINTLAHRLTRMLMARDPLSERVHLGCPRVAGLTLARHPARRVAAARRGAFSPRRKSRGVRE